MGEIAEEASEPAPDLRPSEAQVRYLARGLNEPGGKLPLFDRDGREIPKKTVEACIAHGWAEPWVGNPMKPNWLVCRLTPAGQRVLGQAGLKGLSRTGIADRKPI
jgi:hypothetical protein